MKVTGVEGLVMLGLVDPIDAEADIRGGCGDLSGHGEPGRG